MALQPIDRKLMKHQSKTAKRQQPSMVNRSNKQILPDHKLGYAEASSPRFGSNWWRRFHEKYDWY